MEKEAHTASGAGLIHADLQQKGFTRVKRGRGFSYRDPEGKLVSSREVRERLQALAIPPAWDNVWICPQPEGHIQATGRDKRGRKQYIYHPHWRELRDRQKFARLLEFGHVLPVIRQATEQDLRPHAMSRKKVAALAVRLLDRTLVRVGNPEYARDNKSYGLTTLRKKHISVNGSVIHLAFRGKSGKKIELDISDRRLARLVHKCEQLPGQRLFQYFDADGELVSLDSDDVNGYLQEVTGEEFSAKDFRTWWGTVFAAQLFASQPLPETSRAEKTVINKTLRKVAALLSNTLAVCRTYYVSPVILDTFLSGRLAEIFAGAEAEPVRDQALSTAEEAVLRLLEEQAAAQDQGNNPGEESRK